MPHLSSLVESLGANGFYRKVCELLDANQLSVDDFRTPNKTEYSAYNSPDRPSMDGGCLRSESEGAPKWPSPWYPTSCGKSSSR